MSRKQNLIFLTVLCVMHVCAFIWAALEKPQLRDSAEYLYAAQNFENDGEFYCFNARESIDMRGYTKRPPLYPLIIIALRHQQTLILLFQMLLSISSLFLFHRWILSLTLTKNIHPTVFVLFLFTWIFSFSQFIYAGLVMADLWLQSFTLLLLYWTYQAFKTDHAKYWVFLALGLIAAFLLKPVMSLLVWVLPLAVAIRFFRQPVKLALLLPIALLPIITLLLITQSNERKTGYSHYSSISNINLLHYNTRYTLIAAYGSAEKADSILQPLMVKTADKARYKQNNEDISIQCRALLKEHLSTYLYIHLKGMLRMLIDPGRFDVYSFLKLDKDDKAGLMEKSVSDKSHWIHYVKNQPIGLMGLLGVILLFNLLKIYAWGRFLFKADIPLSLRILFGLAVLYFVGITGPLGASRFLLPVLPLLAVCVLFLPLNTTASKSPHAPE